MTVAANGSRHAPKEYWWVGRENAILPEPTPSHAKCLKTRTPRSGSPTTMAPALFAGDRVHAVLGRLEPIRTLLVQKQQCSSYYGDTSPFTLKQAFLGSPIIN